MAIEWSSVPVRHLKYGEGTVISCDGKIICIDFGSVGAKSFVYPDVFQHFLKTTHPEAMCQVTEDIIFKKAEENAIEREKEQLYRTIQEANRAAAEKPAHARTKKAVK